MKYVGTQFQDSSYPELYQKYAGHDDNRDWFMFNLPETRNLRQRAVARVVSAAGLQHAPDRGLSGADLRAAVQGSDATRTSRRGHARRSTSLGDAMTQRLDREGKVGAVSRQQYDQWWNGGLRSAAGLPQPDGHPVRDLARVGDAGLRGPDEVPEDVPVPGGLDLRAVRVLPEPVQGRQVASERQLLVHRVDRLGSTCTPPTPAGRTGSTGSYRMGEAAIDAGGDNAYMIPADQSDFPTAVKMVNILRRADIEVEQAQSAFTVGDKTYPAGSFIVREAQPFRADVVDLLNPQIYPDRRNPDGSPERPYDMAGWTLPYQMGVKVDKVTQSFIANTKPVDTAAVPAFSRCPTAHAGVRLRARRARQRQLHGRARAAEGGRDRHAHDRPPSRPTRARGRPARSWSRRAPAPTSASRRRPSSSA